VELVPLRFDHSKNDHALAPGGRNVDENGQTDEEQVGVEHLLSPACDVQEFLYERGLDWNFRIRQVV